MNTVNRAAVVSPAADRIATPIVVPRQPAGRRRSGLVRFARSYPIGVVSAWILLLLVLAALFPSFIARYDPLVQSMSNSLRPPDAEHWLGTDVFGRDVWSRLVFGSRVSLYVGFLSVLPAVALGTLIGVTSAYLGGWFDLILQRVVDTLLGFPALVLAIVIITALGPSLPHVTLTIGVLILPTMIRLSRSSALAVSQDVYVLAARMLGAGRLRIVVRHVLPNSTTAVFVAATSALGAAILAEASLSFLGLGTPPPQPSWGGMLNEAVTRGNFQFAPWLAIFPGLTLALVVFAFSLLGDALRDILDPSLAHLT